MRELRRNRLAAGLGSILPEMIAAHSARVQTADKRIGLVAAPEETSR